MSYTYDSTTHKVATRTDAKGQVAPYTYDSYARLTKVQRYPSGLNNNPDACQEEDYYYDGTTPSSSTTVQSSMGHLSAVQYWGGYNPTSSPVCDTTFIETYTYGTPGAPITKQLQVTRNVVAHVNLSAMFTYDNEGRISGETYPTDVNGATANLSYTFDSMGRLNTMTDNIANQQIIRGASYGPANEITGITGGNYLGAWAGESLSYNSLKQLTGLAEGSVSVSYTYPSTGNNGKISSQTDAVSGETVTYTYDSLNRLATAATQSNFNPSWGQSFSYDGFGNLTNVGVTQGSAPTFSAAYDVNNHAGGEDANGDPGSVPMPAYGTSAAPTWDVENRLTALNGSTTSPVVYYSYAPGNKRVWRGNWTYNSGTETWSRGLTDEVTFWSVGGQKMATYQLTLSGSFTATQTGMNYYFGGKLIKNANGWVYADRLGSNGKFYPYGQERPSATTNGTEKFTGYFRDAESGNDYAVNRYQSPGYGRFLTPDRMTGHPSDPESWNRYSYTEGDPINFLDPSGAYQCGTPCSSSNPTVDWSFLNSSGENDTDMTTVCATVAVYGVNYAIFFYGIDPSQIAMDCAGGGGGGYGYVQARVAPGTPQPVVLAINSGYNNAYDHAASFDCANFLTGGAAGQDAVADALNALADTFYRALPLPAGPGTAAQTIDATDVFINTNGAFFNAAVQNNGTVIANMPNSQGVKTQFTFASLATFQGFILLHELGHEMGVLGPDLDAPTNGMNSAGILDNCFTQNAQGVYN